MPRYTYRCESCNEVFEVSHGMFFEQERCIKCKASNCLIKVPVFSIKKEPIESSSPPGRIVDQFIKDAKKDLKQQKTDLASETINK